MTVAIEESFSRFTPAAWNALVAKNNPFMRHEFLSALEESGCIGEQTAWQPRLFASREQDELRAVIPAFMRSDSYGEYIFDWAWANAYAQAGIPYYPKLTVAAPFTPASGNRLLTDEARLANASPALLEAIETYCLRAGISGVHVLCETRAEQRLLSQHGYLPRLTHQYHWINQGYAGFEDYLARLRAHRRKEIRRERKKCAELGLEIRLLQGSEISEEHMLAMYAFYLQTYSRKWGSPYLNREAFLALRQKMPENLVLVLAFDAEKPVAGSIAFRAADRLFGRYWGASGYYPFLHFELCLYRLIEYAIEEKILVFEAGAQGEHKFQRGFTAMPIYSSHRLFHPQGEAAIADFLRRERRATTRALQAYRHASPNKDEPAYLPEGDEEPGRNQDS